MESAEDDQILVQELTRLQLSPERWAKECEEFYKGEIPAGDGRPAQEMTKETLCPLEKALLASGILHKAIYPVKDVFPWASTYLPNSNVDADVGVVQSACLYRSRKAPLHHEYAIICFRNSKHIDSFLRIERAARIKDRWWLPRADSIGPFFSGVTLRESVSFSTVLSSLIANSDEYARVLFDDNAGMAGAPAFPGLTLREVAQQLAITSIANPMYKLFSVNCRWFARQTVLNIAERGTSTQDPLSLSIFWKSRASTIVMLRKKLESETFGGQKLMGKKADDIRLRNLVASAWAKVVAGELDECVELCMQAMRVLDQVASTDPEHVDVDAFIFVLFTLGWAEQQQGKFSDALTRFETTIELLKLSDDDPGQTDDTVPIFTSEFSGFARFIYQTFIPDETEDILVPLTERWEAISKRRRMVNRFLFAHTYHVQGTILLSIPERSQEAIMSYEEVVKLHRLLHVDFPDLFRVALASSLYDVASHLFGSERWADALPLIKESIELTRASLPHTNSTALQIPLATRIGLHADILSNLERYGEAVQVCKESASLLETFYDASGGTNSSCFEELTLRLLKLADYQDSSHDASEACITTTGCLALERANLAAQIPNTHEWTTAVNRVAATLIVCISRYTSADQHPLALTALAECSALVQTAIFAVKDGESENPMGAQGYTAWIVTLAATAYGLGLGDETIRASRLELVAQIPDNIREDVALDLFTVGILGLTGVPPDPDEDGGPRKVPEDVMLQAALEVIMGRRGHPIGKTLAVRDAVAALTSALRDRDRADQAVLVEGMTDLFEQLWEPPSVDSPVSPTLPRKSTKSRKGRRRQG